MKFTISICVAVFLSISLSAQVQLSGIVLTTNQKPIEFASVSVYPLKDSTQIIGVITQADGSFIFLKLNTGNYQLTIQMLGYEDWKQSIELRENSHLEPIILKEEVTLLEEVEVIARQSVIESHLGKKVLWLGQDLATTGSTALEALDIIPSVTTTPRGQIQIRGNANVIIYINGKATKRDPSTLKFIAAESLTKIEIITNPSAKYDAEGVGGIINLVYKKNKSAAFKLELISNLSVLTNPFYLNPNGGINVSVTKKRISFFANLSSDYGKYEDYVDSRRINFQDSLQGYENLGIHKGLGMISNALIGCSIEPDSTTSIGLEINYDRWDILSDIRQQNIFDYKYELDRSFDLSNERRELENELWINVAFEKDFAKKRTLKISLTAGGENENNFSKSEAVDLNDFPSNVQQFLRSSDERESQRYYQGEVDYVSPFFNWGTIETGIKVDFVKYNIFQKIALRSNAIKLPDNDFTMDMQKLGVYLLQKKQIKKLEYGLGLRLEQFASKAFQEKDQSTFTQRYIRLFPSVQLNYLLSGHAQTLSFNYTRRINRPGFFDLNPYVSYEDPLNLETGNPALRPEIADLLELAYHQEWNRITIDLTLYNRKTNDAIQSFVTPIDNNRTLASSVNIGNSNSSGVELQLEYRPVKKIKTTGSFVWSQNKFEDSENEISYNKQRNWSIRLRQQWSLNKNWKIEFSEIYRAPSYQIQEKRHEAFYVNFGLSKKFKDKRGSVSLALRDVFNTRQYIYSLLTSDFEIEKSYKWQTRQVTLGLTYVLFDKKN